MFPAQALAEEMIERGWQVRLSTDASMKRRMEESLLDECPGISQARKKELIKRFGSPARLRRASAEEIAQVPGIGKGLAGDIVKFLETR